MANTNFCILNIGGKMTGPFHRRLVMPQGFSVPRWQDSTTTGTGLVGQQLVLEDIFMVEHRFIINQEEHQEE